jgi:hypothetical protein
MFFEAQRYSWSEAHYYLAVNDFNSTIGPATSLCMLREALTGQYADLVGCRLSYVPANRQVFDLRNSALGGGGPRFDTIMGGETTDQPFTSILLNIQNLNANKNLYLSGIPDGVIVIDPNYPNGYEPQGDFGNQLTGYMNFLTGMGTSGGLWGFRSRVKLAGQNVSNVADQPGYGNNIGVETAANPGIAVGQSAYLTGFKRINPRTPSLAGAYIVVAVIPPGSGNPNFITVLQETGNVDEDNFLALGVIAPLQFQYLPYQNWILVRVTHRKRGGSYALPRGRSRARR